MGGGGREGGREREGEGRREREGGIGREGKREGERGRSMRRRDIPSTSVCLSVSLPSLSKGNIGTRLPDVTQEGLSTLSQSQWGVTRGLEGGREGGILS